MDRGQRSLRPNNATAEAINSGHLSKLIQLKVNYNQLNWINWIWINSIMCWRLLIIWWWNWTCWFNLIDLVSYWLKWECHENLRTCRKRIPKHPPKSTQEPHLSWLNLIDLISCWLNWSFLGSSKTFQSIPKNPEESYGKS